MTAGAAHHDLLEGLAGALAAEARALPGDRPERQPVHTVYGGAHLFRADTAPRLGERALAALERFAATPEELAAALGWPVAAPAERELAATVHERVLAKLRREPVEDFRIDFEDGYGPRPDAEEDGHAAAAGRELARGAADGTLPPFVGIRIKPLTRELAPRALRTLDLVVTTAVANGRRPAGRLRRHPAQGDAARAGRHARRGARGPRGALRARRRGDPARADGRDAAARSSPPTAGRRSRRWSAPPAAAAAAPTSAPTTTPPRSASPRRSRRWTTRPATSPSR